MTLIDLTPPETEARISGVARVLTILQLGSEQDPPFGGLYPDDADAKAHFLAFAAALGASKFQKGRLEINAETAALLVESGFRARRAALVAFGNRQAD